MKRPSKSILDDRSTLVEDLEQGAPASRVWLYLVALFVTLATLAAYQPTLFNFFNADDFVLLNWLKAASKDHSLVWQEFGRPWLGLMSNYYRPLVNMVLAAEYSIWGTNGLYFRLANILCELFTSLVIGLIVYELSGSNRQANSERLRLTWSIAAAALFALYPLHCEPINWVVSQLEVMVTLFGLFSLWCYMRWRRSNQKRFLISGLSSLIFAFLSKEMAVVLPLIMFIYEFLLVDRNGTEEGTRGVRSVASQAGKALIQTLPFWLILAAYLALRKVVLGQIFGSVGATALFGPAQVFHASLHSLWKTFVPINQSALSLLSPAAILWQVFIAAFFGMSVYKFRASADKSLAMFLLAWMICAIAPIYSVFLIDSNLLRARLAYMATVPICIMLTYGISAFCSNPKFSRWARSGLIAMLALAGLLLYINNSAYAKTALVSNKLIAELQKYYQVTPGDPQVYVLGVPAVLNGAYILGINSLSDLTKTPFIDRDIEHCRVLDSYNASFPPGLNRKPVVHKINLDHYLFWETESQSLKPVMAYPLASDSPSDWEGKALIEALSPASESVVTTNDGVTVAIGSNRRPAVQFVLPGLPCWPVDSICMKIQLTSRLPSKSSNEKAELSYCNDVNPTYTGTATCQANLTPTNQEQTVIFPLGNQPYWTFGGKCHSLRLLLPKGQSFKVKKIWVRTTSN